MTNQELTNKIMARKNEFMVVTNSRCGNTYYQYHINDQNIHTLYYHSAKAAYKAANTALRRREFIAERNYQLFSDDTPDGSGIAWGSCQDG